MAKLAEPVSGKLGWRVCTVSLLEEALRNPGASALVIPVRIFSGLLYDVAKRAAELNDPELNKLMLRLSLYDVADPENKNYDPEFVRQYLYGDDK